MNIRAKLTLTFFFIVIVVLTVICFSIYFLSDEYRKVDFTRRLKNRAINTAKVLTEVKDVNAELLRRMEHNNPASLSGQFITIFNNRNTVLYVSDGAPPIVIDSLLLNRIRQRAELQFRDGHFEILGFMFKSKNDDFTIIAAATDVYGLAALDNLRNVLIGTFIVSAFFVGMLGWFYSGRVLEPISRIVNQVDTISALNLSDRLDEGKNGDELSRLSQTFNRMLGRLQAAFISQKNFIANASHEFKTPLTVMRTEIEVALLQVRDPNYYINMLQSILGGINRLNGLSTQLLQLAQASADFPGKDFAQLRVDDIIWEIKEEMTRMCPEYRIEIDFEIDVDTNSLVVNGDEQLIKVALFNLMQNGCKFSDNQWLLIKLETFQQTLVARFINSGKGIEPSEIGKIFEPFYRTKSFHHIKGAGIGLSLVSRIAELHKGTVTVDSIPDHVTEFRLKLPLG